MKIISNLLMFSLKLQNFKNIAKFSLKSSNTLKILKLFFLNNIQTMLVLNGSINQSVNQSINQLINWPIKYLRFNEFLSKIFSHTFFIKKNQNKDLWNNFWKSAEEEEEEVINGRRENYIDYFDLNFLSITPTPLTNNQTKMFVIIVIVLTSNCLILFSSTKKAGWCWC